MSVATRERAQLLRGGEGLIAARGGDAQQPSRLRGVHLHDVGVRFQRQAEPLVVGVEGDLDAGITRLERRGRGIRHPGAPCGIDPLMVNQLDDFHVRETASTSSVHAADGTSDPCS